MRTATLAVVIAVIGATPTHAADPLDQLWRNQQQYQLRQLRESVEDNNALLQYQEQARQSGRDYMQPHRWLYTKER